LSDFLTGLNQPKIDQVSGVPRTFHELLDRQMKLDVAVNMSCGRRASRSRTSSRGSFRPRSCTEAGGSPSALRPCRKKKQTLEGRS